MEMFFEGASCLGQRARRAFAKSILVAFTTVLPLSFVPPVQADPASQPRAISGVADQMSIGEAGGDSQVELALRSIQAIATWLSTEFGFPALAQYPRVEFASPERLAMLRYSGSPQPLAHDNLPSNGLAALSQDTVAIYLDTESTIYLSTAWTGNTPADSSVLVHEMVHHQQNLASEKFECPQEREKLAYAAQERWLARFGRSLEADFKLDGFSLLPKTRCLY
jgi:hypothetical protein